MEKAGWISPNILASDQVVRNTSIPGAADYFALLKNPKLNWIVNSSTMSTFGTFNTFFRQSRIEMQDGQTTIDQLIQKTQAEFDTQVAAAG